MSSIPPDPPDPPTSTGLSTLTSSDSVSTRKISRRGRHRSHGQGRGRQIQHAHIVDNGVGTSAPGGVRDHLEPTTQERSMDLSEGIGKDSTSSRQDVINPSGRVRDTSQRSGRRGVGRNTDGSHSGPSGRARDTSRGSNSRRMDHTPDREQSGLLQTDFVSTVAPRNPGSSRRRHFGSQTTEQRGTPHPSRSQRPSSPPHSSNLATRLTYALRTPPYPDCPICFNALHPAQPTWSCSLSDEVTSCCWASFHLKCIREWANKSTKEIRDALVARELNEEEYWRCPGCQAKRTQVPRGYL